MTLKDIIRLQQNSIKTSELSDELLYKVDFFYMFLIDFIEDGDIETIRIVIQEAYDILEQIAHIDNYNFFKRYTNIMIKHQEKYENYMSCACLKMIIDKYEELIDG